MDAVKKEWITFPSSNGSDTVTGYFYKGTAEPRAVIQLSHGMCEYLAFYDEAAEFLVKRGFAVCGNDHLGHGATSGDTRQNGFFAERDGARYVLQDLAAMNALARQRYPEVPGVLLGHSMGSFFARAYAAEYGETLAGLILSGTGGPNPLAGVGRTLAAALTKLHGPRYVSEKLDRLVFGGYNRRIPYPRTQYDWISRDADFIDRYRVDQKCTFRFSVSAFHELFTVVQQVNTEEWARRVPKALPVYFYAGTEDPVGDYGRGVRASYELLRKTGHRDLALRLYRGGRHDMLHERNSEEVRMELLMWLGDRF